MKLLKSFVLFLFIVPLFFPTSSQGQGFNFVPNDIMTTPYGPAWADILLEPTNFVPCEGGPIALCYYSGPEPEKCELVGDGTFANCECFEIPYGKYFVDINAILNKDVYLATVDKCGADGSGCQDTNSAPVCESINDGTFFPGTDMISTFSFACVPEEGIGQTNCAKSLYAGCMTAPCTRTGEDGIVECLCPTYDGPFQVGLNGQSCTLDDDMVWSAAYNPEATGTVPTPPFGGCIPDAPESLGGCPLIPEDIPQPPPNIDCGEVCDEYESCFGSQGVEIGYTCDATLCTSQCNDRDLVEEACSGLQDCEISEIVKLELEVGCSCCASQICGCDADAMTQEAVYDVNKRQRERGITPQCDLNGTLCGEKSGGNSSCSLAPVGTGTAFPFYLLIPGFIVVRRLWNKGRS